MQQIPLQPIPSQIVKTVVGGQNCEMLIYQKDQGLFFNLNANGSDVVDGIICENANPLVCIQYNGFQGNFFFIDTQGNSDPNYAGLGTRFNLIYITAAENALI